MTTTRTHKRTALKVLAAVTAAGAITLSGATAAFAADGAGSMSGSVTVAERPGHARPFREARRAAFTAAADTLAFTIHDLRAEMKNGPQSIASIAGAQTDEVTAAIVAVLSARIDEAVAAGNVPAARAEKAKSRLPAVAARIVNRVPGS